MNSCGNVVSTYAHNCSLLVHLLLYWYAMRRQREQDMATDFAQIDQLLAEGWDNRLNNVTEGQRLSEQALQMAQAEEYTVGIMRGLRNLAAIHNAMHDYEKGLAYVHDALAMLDEKETADDAFDLYLLAAGVYVRLGNIPEAIKYCYQAENLPLTDESLSRKAELYKTIGNAYLTVQEYETAVSYYHQAREIFQTIDDTKGEIIILNNLCHCLHHSGQYDDALRYGLLGLDLYTQITNLGKSIQRVHGYTLNNVGSAYIKSKQFNEAIPYFEKALEIFGYDMDSYGEVYSWRGLGQISLHNKNYDEAILRFQRSLMLAEKSGIATELILANRVLAKAYKQMGDYEKSLEYFEKFYEFEKNIVNDEIEKKIRNLEATHRVQQAQKESEIYQIKSVELQNEIDERKRAENRLQTYARELERSNKDLENFASIVSHDLQTPLRKVMVFGDRLQDRYAASLDERGINYITRMRSAATRMQGLIDDLLTLSHITTQQQPFNLISLNQIAQNVLIDLEVAIDEKKATVHVDDLPDIEADGTQLRQLFQNFIGNALKFNRPGIPPKIEIKYSCVEQDDQKFCQLQFIDNGIGFDPKYSERIFVIFERLTPQSDVQGTGIGLAICLRIVERHGGKINVESVPDEGTTFVVKLPFQQV